MRCHQLVMGRQMSYKGPFVFLSLPCPVLTDVFAWCLLSQALGMGSSLGLSPVPRFRSPQGGWLVFVLQVSAEIPYPAQVRALLASTLPSLHLFSPGDFS